MEIFALAIYSCVAVNDLSGDLVTKTCRWSSLQRHFSTRELCDAAAAAEIGKPVFSFQIVAGQEQERVSQARCSLVAVVTK